MSSSNGPKPITSGLVFSMDVANPKGINASGCVGYNNAPQLINNLVGSDTTTSSSTVRLGNATYYTAFAIDYPEGSYGGSAAGRNGITQGFNVTSGTKTYDSSRALHLWVWNEDSAAWVPDSYFSGERLSGHCYDSYLGTGSVDLFVADYNKIKSTFPNCTYIVMGSHRDSAHTTAQYTILKDLGAPSNVDSIINFSAPEWILVGKPGIGPGNGAWSFENYPTDSVNVAHMNFCLPFKGTKDNYLSFNGSSDYVIFPENSALNTQTPTVEVWVKTNATTQNGFWFEKGQVNTQYSLFQEGSVIQWRQNIGGVTNLSTTTASYMNTSGWYHVVATYTSGSRILYINGVQVNSDSQTGTISTNTNGSSIGVYGGYNGGRGYYYNGNIAITNVYNRVLSADEVKQNFNALRGRFGV